MSCVWILNHYAVTPGEVGTVRHYALSSHLADCGWKPIIIAASVQHWTGTQRIPGLALKSDVYVKGIHFRFLKTTPYRGNNPFRLLNMFSYFLAALLPVSTSDLEKPDIIVGSSVHPLAAVAACLLAKRHGVPFVFEIRDLWPQTLIDMGGLRNRPLIGLLRYIEKQLYIRAESIITLLPKADDYIKGLGLENKRIHWLPNGAQTGPLSEKQPGREIRIMYVGAHGRANDLFLVLDAIRILNERQPDNNLVFEFIGEGTMKNRLIEARDRMRLDNVFFRDPVPKENIPEEMSRADAFVITVRDLPGLYKYGVSMNKIYDYMAAARPVVIAIEAANNPVEESGGGITVSPGDPEELAGAFEQLSRMSHDERRELGVKAYHYVCNHHDYRKLGKAFHDILSEDIERYKTHGEGAAGTG